ncbi:hypothetical protein Prum_086860 [Phytohabitans rumicis]|uniref:Uncharacterized protein n=1 Tax=Phytohabitans rumicis TaxID=1076125 RepID=A0A6V8LFG7_9ACTN|nr:hypothetical protein Prum_086860 [Phytohabitans rumicis]
MREAATDRVPQGEQAERHEDETEHCEQMRGHPCPRTDGRDGSVHRGLVVPRPNGGIENKQDTRDSERDGTDGSLASLHSLKANPISQRRQPGRPSIMKLSPGRALSDHDNFMITGAKGQRTRAGGERGKKDQREEETQW